MGASGKTKKRQKILIQTGAVLFILFAFLTISVRNMMTMSSFSAALTDNLIYMKSTDTIAEDMKEYEALKWLTRYWSQSYGHYSDEGRVKNTAAWQVASYLRRTYGADTAVDYVAEELAAGNLMSDEAADLRKYLRNEG